METRQQMPSRTAVYAATGVIVLLAIGLASITHAETINLNSKDGTGVFIGANGNAHVHGAKVTATSTSGLTATTNLGGNTITWAVDATSTTRFGNLGTGLSALAQVAIGDIVSFWGKLSGTGSTLEVDAYTIKDQTDKATSTKKVGKGRGWGQELRERFNANGAFKNFLNAHDKFKARFEARFGVGAND